MMGRHIRNDPPAADNVAAEVSDIVTDIVDGVIADIEERDPTPEVARFVAIPPKRGHYEIRWQGPERRFRFRVVLVMGDGTEVTVDHCHTMRGGQRSIRRDRKRRFEGKWQPAGTVIFKETA